MARKRKIGVMIESFRLGVAEGIKKAKEIGADGFQIYVTSGEMYPDNMSKEKRADFKRFVASLGLQISALCADFDWIKGFMHKDHNAVNKPRVKKCVDLAVDLGVKILPMHTGRLPEGGTDPLHQEALATTIELAKYAEDRGCILATETGPEAPESLLKFLKKVPSKGVGVNYDPANLVMCGPFDQIGGVSVLRDYIVHTHAKDGVHLGAGKHKELPLGEGGVVFPYWLAALDKIGYDGFLTIEREVGDNPVADIAKAMAFLRGFDGKELPSLPWD